MIKSLTTGLCIVAFTGSLAFAQSSQGQSGAATSPTSVNAQTTQGDAMNANAKMKKKKMKMKKSGMSSGMSGGMAKDGTGMGTGAMGGSARKDGMGGGMSK